MSHREQIRSMRLKQWKEIFEAQMQSGLKVRDFCRQNNLSKDQYYYWLKLVRDDELQRSPQTFMELTTPVPNAVTTVDKSIPHMLDNSLVISYKSAQITVTQETSRELLLMVMEVLSHVR